MQRLKFLDAARAIAVLYVLFFHTIGIWKLEYPKQLTQFVQSGGSGVILFFVVSGFSLCLTMGRHLDHTKPMLSYAFARIFRIVPLYYFLLILTVYRDFQWRDVTHAPEKILSMATFTFNLSPEWAKGIVWASWTIGVEMIFYATFPLLYRYLPDIWRKLAAILAMCLLTLALKEFYLPTIENEAAGRSYAYMMMPRNFAIFICGMALFDIFRVLEAKTIQNRESLGFFITLSGVTLVAFLAVMFRHTWGKTLFVDYGLLQAIAYSTLILGLALYPWKFLINRVTDFYSKICYSAYLWHPFLIWMMKPIYDRVYAYEISLWWKVFGVFAITLVVVSIVGELSFRFIEKPGQRFGKKLLAKLTSAYEGHPLPKKAGVKT